MKKARSEQLAMGVELCLLALALHVFLVVVLRRYSLAAIPGVSVTFADPFGPLCLAFLLLCLRSAIARGGRYETQGSSRRWRPGAWLTGLAAPGLILAAAFFIMVYLFHHYGGRLGNDGVLQYVYVRSLVMDGDLDFTNEFEDFVPEKFQFIAEQARRVGRTPDPLSEPGPALLWAPWLAAAHGIVLVERAAGGSLPADGYSYPYINAVCFGSLVWAFLAVFLAYRAAARYVSPSLAAVCAAILWFGTTLFWYSIYNPSMPHAISAAAVAVFLSIWLRFRESPSPAMWLAIGLSAGLLISIQRYNVFFLVAPAMTILGRARDAFRATGWTAARGGLAPLAWAAVGFLVMAAPLLVYNVFYTREGTFFRWGESLEAHYLRFWREPRIGEFLFSSNHGLFAWTPLVYLSAIGLFLLLRKDRRVAGVLLLTFGAGVYLLSSTWDWYAGTSFGSRRMTESFFIFVLGFAALAENLSRRPRLLAAALVAPFLVWNFALAEQMRAGALPEFGTFSFGQAGMRAVERLHAWMGYPGSAPANWMFADRYGVPPSRFDTVYGHRRYHNLAIDVGAPSDVAFLGMGWSVAERRRDGVSFRWSEGDESSWIVPLFGPFDYRLTLTGGPSRHPEAQPQSVSILVNGAPVRSLLWPQDGSPTREIVIPRDFWREGLNAVVLRYGWTAEAGEVYGGTDERRVAIWLERLELRIEGPATGTEPGAP